MPLKMNSDGTIRRGRGRPSNADRRFESELARRLRSEAEEELRRELGEADDALEKGYRHRLARTYRGEPPAEKVISGRVARFLGLVAAGLDEEAARRQAKLQLRAIRRLSATSPIFRNALDGARTAAKVAAKP